MKTDYASAGSGPHRASFARRLAALLYNAAPWLISFALIGGMVYAPHIVALVKGMP